MTQLRGRFRRGVTLLELLVAMVLFSLLSTGVFWALRLGLSTLGRTRDHVADARRTWGAERALESLLAGLTPAVAEFMLPGVAQVQGAPFFQGDPQAMRFLSRYSLSGGARSAPRMMELAVIPREDRGGVRLVLNEIVFTGPRGLGLAVTGRSVDPLTNASFIDFRPILAGPQTFVLADRLTECQFWYLDRGPAERPELWRARWPTGLLPRAVRIEMGGPRRLTASIQVSELARP